MSTFWNASLKSKGDTLRTYRLFKLLQILYNNFENSKNNFAHIDKLYILSFRLNPKMCLDFEMVFSRVKLNAGN